MALNFTILPVVTEELPISTRFTPYDFSSRCKFSTLTTRQSMVEFYLLTSSRFPLRKKNRNSGDENRTHAFCTSSCAGYLLLIDHSGDDCSPIPVFCFLYSKILPVTKMRLNVCFNEMALFGPFVALIKGCSSYGRNGGQPTRGDG